jgi:hypothetical protein
MNKMFVDIQNGWTSVDCFNDVFVQIFSNNVLAIIVKTVCYNPFFFFTKCSYGHDTFFDYSLKVPSISLN